ILKTLLIAASVAIIVVGVAQTAMEFLFPDAPSAPATLPPKDESQSPAAAPQPPATIPGRPMPSPQGALPMPPNTDPASTNSINRVSSFFDPSTVIKIPEVTGSIPRKPAAQPKTPAPAGSPSLEALPTSLSPALRAAVAASDP